MKTFVGIVLLWLASAVSGFGAGCASTAYGGFTCVSHAGGVSSNTFRNQTISVTAGDAVLLTAFVPTTGFSLTLTDSGACTGTINTLGGSISTGSAAVSIIAATKATSTGTCTITITWGGSSNSIESSAWDFQGWNGAFDAFTVAGAGNRVQVVGTGTTNFSCPAVTTVQTGDLILCMGVETGNNGGTYTAAAPFAITLGNNSMTQIADVQAAAGSITPQMHYSQSSTYILAVVALESSAVPPSPTYTLSNWNGLAPAGGAGGFNRLNGAYFNPSTGFLGTYNGLTTPFSAIQATNLVDMSGGTNGVEPASADLGTSTKGTAGWSWTTTQVAAGTSYSNGTTFGTLPEPVVVGGTAYNSSGPLSWHCTSSINAGGTANSCDSATMSIPSVSPSVSAGFWYTTPNCNSGGTQDCGAMGILSGGTDYVNMHVNSGGKCPQNGMYLESHGGNSTDCLPFTNGAVYRVNGQENVGHAALTVTFTNGSASIAATNSLAANQPVILTTTGSLPTNFNLQLGHGTYTSGITVTGAVGTTCTLTSFNGSGSGAIGIVYVGSTANTITSGNGISWVSQGSGYTSAPTSATASNGSATCSGTAVISTVLSTPPLFVSSTGLSGSVFQLATTQGGTPIVAGSAGSGTHTATQVDLLTVCQVSGSSLIPLGYVYATTDTSASSIQFLQTGVSGEGPTIAGFDFYWGGYVVDNAGKISLTECVL